MILVLLFHAYPSLLPNGYLGVDIFFVISGYVVTPMIEELFRETKENDRLKKIKEFYLKRFLRLSPALGFMLIIMGVATFLFGLSDVITRFSEQGLATLLILGNFGAFKFSGNYFSPSPNPLIHTWSLSVEEQIYLTIPLILYFIFKIRKKYSLDILKFTYLILFIISLLLEVFPSILAKIYQLQSKNFAVGFPFYSPITRVWEFTLGGLAYLFITAALKKKYLSSKIYLYILPVVLLFSTLHIGYINFYLVAILVSLVTALILSIGVERNYNFKLLTPLVWFGNRSYSIYLYHMPILYLSLYCTPWNGIILSRIIIPFGMFVSILAGSLSYKFVERKFRYEINSANNKVNIKHTYAILTGAVLLFTSMLSFSLSTLATGNELPVIDPNSTAWWYPDRCQKYSTPVSYTYQPCLYNDNSTNQKSIMLIGDSVAADYSYIMRDIAKKQNAKIYIFTFEGCGFINSKNFEKIDKHFRYQALIPLCIKHNDAIIDFLKHNKVDLLIWAHRASTVHALPNTARSRLSYNTAMLKTLLLVKPNVKNILVVGPLNEILLPKNYFKKITGGKAIWNKIPIYDDSYWASYQRGNYHYVRTLDTFCPKENCFNKIGKDWLFFDEAHLTKDGTIYEEPQILKAVNVILQRQK